MTGLQRFHTNPGTQLRRQSDTMLLSRSAQHVYQHQHCTTALCWSLAALQPHHGPAGAAWQHAAWRATSACHVSSRGSWPRNRPLVTAAAAAPDAGPATSTQHPLVDWVLRNGGSVNSVGVANLAGSDGGSGWGLVATQAISQRGQRLVELPRCCHLTYDESSDPRVLTLIQQVPEELWGAKLALQVLVARVKGPDSPYAPYIASLPVGVSGVPMFYSREDLEAIQYPPVVEQVKKRGRWLHRFSLDVLSKLPGTPDDPFEGVSIDINSLGWALAVVSSRAFRVAGPKAPAALLPLIDMANHSFEPNCEVLPVPGGVALVAKRAIAAGEPLLLSYGPLSNDFLLMDYGFVVQRNPHDRVALRFDVDLINAAAVVGGAVDGDGQLLEVSSGVHWRQLLLKKLGLSNDKKSNQQVLLGGPLLVEPRLLAAVRGLVASYQSEVENLTLEVLGSWDRPLNKRNETATLRILIGLAMTALQNFTTALDHDKALLAGTSSSSSASSSHGSSSNGSSAANSSSTGSAERASNNGNGMESSSSSSSSNSNSSQTGELLGQQTQHSHEQQQQQQTQMQPSQPQPCQSVQQQQQQATDVLQPATDMQQVADVVQPLTGDLQLAVMFRAEKKQLLLDVITGLADKLKQVPKIAGLKESAVVAARKGQKPRPATKKGFGR